MEKETTDTKTKARATVRPPTYRPGTVLPPGPASPKLLGAASDLSIRKSLINQVSQKLDLGIAGVEFTDVRTQKKAKLHYPYKKGWGIGVISGSKKLPKKLTHEIRALSALAKQTKEPLNLFVTPRTESISSEIRKLITGDIFVYDHTTGLIHPARFKKGTNSLIHDYLDAAEVATRRLIAEAKKKSKGRNDRAAREAYMNRELRTIERNPRHGLRDLTRAVLKDGTPVLHKNGIPKRQWNLADAVDTGRTKDGRYHASDRRYVVQAGDTYTYAANGSRQYSLQSANANQTVPHFEKMGVIYLRETVIIDGSRVEFYTAKELANDPQFPSLTNEKFARAKRVYPPEHPKSQASSKTKKPQTTAKKRKTNGKLRQPVAPITERITTSNELQKARGINNKKGTEQRPSMKTKDGLTKPTSKSNGSKGKPYFIPKDDYKDDRINKPLNIRGTTPIGWSSMPTGEGGGRETSIDSKSKGNKGTFFRKSGSGKVSTKGKAVAGVAGAVQMLGRGFRWLGDRKQEEKVKRAYSEARRKVEDIKAAGRIGMITGITEVKTKEKFEADGNLNDPFNEIFVCWYVQSYRDSNELHGFIDKRFVAKDSSSVKRKKLEEFNSCRQPRPGYEQKFYDREVYNSTSGDFSGSIIGVYRPYKIDNLPPASDESVFMQRELTFSYSQYRNPHRFIMTGVVLPEKKILHLAASAIRYKGEDLNPINKVDGRSISFDWPPRSLAKPVYNYKRDWRFNSKILIDVIITPEDYSIKIYSRFLYLPSADTDKPAELLEQFIVTKGTKIIGTIGTKISASWVQQPHDIEPVPKEPRRGSSLLTQ